MSLNCRAKHWVRIRRPKRDVRDNDCKSTTFHMIVFYLEINASLYRITLLKLEALDSLLVHFSSLISSCILSLRVRNWNLCIVVLFFICFYCALVFKIWKRELDNVPTYLWGQVLILMERLSCPRKWWLIFCKKPNKPLKDVIG